MKPLLAVLAALAVLIAGAGIAKYLMDKNKTDYDQLDWQ